MGTVDDHYPDLLGPRAAPERRRLVADLDQVCAASRLDADRDRAIARLLYDRASTRNRQMAARGNRGRVLAAPFHRHRALIAVATLAAVIFLGGTLAALRGHASVDRGRPLSSSLTSTAAASLSAGHTATTIAILAQPSLATSTLVSGASSTLVSGASSTLVSGPSHSPTPANGMARSPATTATPVSTPALVYSPSPTS